MTDKYNGNFLGREAHEKTIESGKILKEMFTKKNKSEELKKSLQKEINENPDLYGQMKLAEIENYAFGFQLGKALCLVIEIDTSEFYSEKFSSIIARNLKIGFSRKQQGTTLRGIPGMQFTTKAFFYTAAINRKKLQKAAELLLEAEKILSKLEQQVEKEIDQMIKEVSKDY